MRSNTVFLALRRLRLKNYDLKDWYRHFPKKERFKAFNQNPDLKKLLLEQNTLDVWAPYSLQERVDIIKKIFGVSVSKDTLRSFYRHHCVSYVTTKVSAHVKP